MLEFYDGIRARHRAGISPDPGYRTRSSLRRRLVAARARTRLRARIHPSGGRPRHALAGRATDPSFADGLGVQRVLAAVESSAARDSAWTPIPIDSGGP